MPLLYSIQKAARALDMGVDELEKWLANGRLKYALRPGCRKRRIYYEDLKAFADWYRGEYACPPSRGQAASIGNTTSSSKVLAFKGSLMEKMAYQKSRLIVPRKRLTQRKPLLESLRNNLPKSDKTQD